MKLKKMIILAAVSTTLFASIPNLEGFGLNFGPFDLRFGEDNGRDDRGYEGSRREAILDNPICRAISQQQKLEFLVEGKEKINAKEVKITTKRVTVEPYAFGFTKDRQPVLRGAVVDEKLVREVTIKFGENQPEAEAPGNNPNHVSAQAKESDDITIEVKNKGEEQNNKSFSGLFRSHKSKENVESLNLTKVGNIHILENSHFDVPKNLKTLFKDDIDQVVCQVPSLRSSDSQPQTGKIYSQDYAATDQDKQLNTIVRDKLSSKFSNSYDKTIVIKTSNGVVTVTGTVDKFEDIQKIGDLIKGIAGVKKVDNQLTLKK
jgi:hypothetical protein